MAWAPDSTRLGLADKVTPTTPGESDGIIGPGRIFNQFNFVENKKITDMTQT